MQSQSNLSIEKKENLLTPESVLPMYHTYLESRNSSQHTIKAYLKKVKICWETLYELGYTSLDQITVNTIEELSVYLSMREWRGELINSNTVRHFLIGFKNLFDWMYRSELILSNPFEIYQLPKLVKKLPYKIPTLQEVRHILNSPDTSTMIGSRDKAMFCLGFEGMRSEEVRSLKVKDLSLKSLRIKFMGKGNKEALITISKETAQAISEYLKFFRADVMLGYTQGGAPPYHGLSAISEGYLFASKNGNMMSAGNLLARLQKYAVELDWDWVPRFHSLRGAMCTSLHQAGCSLVDIQRLARHESIETTLGYIRSDTANLKKVHEKFHPLSNGFKGAKNGE